MLLAEASPWQVACEGGPPPHAGDPPSSRRTAASAGTQVEDHASAAFLSPHRPCGRRIISISGAQTRTSSRGAWQLQQCLGGAPHPAAQMGNAAQIPGPSPLHHRAVALVTASHRSEWRWALSTTPPAAPEPSLLGPRHGSRPPTTSEVGGFPTPWGPGFGPSSTTSSRRFRCALALLHTRHARPPWSH